MLIFDWAMEQICLHFKHKIYISWKHECKNLPNLMEYMPTCCNELKNYTL